MTLINKKGIVLLQKPLIRRPISSGNASTPKTSKTEVLQTPSAIGVNISQGGSTYFFFLIIDYFETIEFLRIFSILEEKPFKMPSVV